MLRKKTTLILRLIKSLFILLLIVGCSTEPVDCAGVAGGTAVEDCNGVCNGDAEIDGCGICGGNNYDECGICGEWIQIIPQVIGFGNCFNIDSTAVIDLGLGEHITGNIPTQIGYLINLSYLDLSNSGDLVGDIPEEIGNLINLQYLDLSNNQLTSIPEELCNIYPNLTDFDVSANNICGTLPSCLTAEDIGEQDCP